MIDLNRVDPRHYDDIAVVVEELVGTVNLDPDSVLVVGAGCRDILHAALGHEFLLRATTDADLGIAVGDWGVINRIGARYRRIGTNGIRYLICDLAVDIMPFGGVEDPEGITRPAARKGEDLVVFGFRDVHERALHLELPNALSVRLPHPAGYGALKMRSWIDRSVYGEDKDAKDLALAAFWYQQSQEIQDLLYDTEWFEVLNELEMDVELAATRVLASDIARQLSPGNRADLAGRWAQQDLEDLARSFALPAASSRPWSLVRRQEIIAQLSLAQHLTG